MAKFNTLSELIDHTLSARRFEPEMRVKDLHHVKRGLRNRTVYPHHVCHTYEIKNGISASSLVAKNITENNSLLKKLKG